jgi:hypothetical protein
MTEYTEMGIGIFRLSTIKTNATKTPKTKRIYSYTVTLLTSLLINDLLVEFQVDNALPFSMVENCSFLWFANALQPQVSTMLPKHRSIQETHFMRRLGVAKTNMDESISEELMKGHRAGLSVDGCHNVN